MKEYTIAQQIALIGLEGLDSIHGSVAKYAVLRGIAVGKCLERLMEEEKDMTPVIFLNELELAVEEIKSARKKTLRQIEEEMVLLLATDGILEEIQDLRACDIDFETAGVSIRVYRIQDCVYQRMVESIRAEILEDGAVTLECLALLWLMRESGCLHDHFSIKEQEQINRRFITLSTENILYRGILALEFHSKMENISIKYLRIKKNMFKNPYLQGVNLLFPFIERRAAIFIDTVLLGTSMSTRRSNIMSHLCKRGHFVEESVVDNEVLLRIDNNYYRLVPFTRSYAHFPVQGVSLLPVYR